MCTGVSQDKVGVSSKAHSVNIGTPPQSTPFIFSFEIIISINPKMNRIYFDGYPDDCLKLSGCSSSWQLFNNIDICQVGEARYIKHKKEAAFLWSAKGEMS